MSAAAPLDVFLSYHWRDHARVEAVARWLRDRGLSVFLDRWYLAAGQPWPEALERALGRCRAVAVFVGPGEMGPWQQREKHLALERQGREAGFPVIPVLLPQADPVLGFLGQNTWIDLRERPDDPARLALLLAAIRREPPGPDAWRTLDATLATLSPYRGLQYFREEDAAVFFGREVAADRLREAVARRNLIALVGASGSGKSSVVRAGLLPRLRRGGDRVWEVATFVPGDRPLHALAAALVPLLEPDMTETDRLIEIGKQARAFRKGDLRLRDIAARVLEKQPGTDRLLLVVDQWEELYTLTTAEPDDRRADGAEPGPEDGRRDAAERGPGAREEPAAIPTPAEMAQRVEAVRRRFVDHLLEASRAAPVSVVLTLRGDFVGQALGYRPLSDALQDAQINLGPMNRSELERAITAPARSVGLGFEPGLVERILDDVGDEPGNLPLLEFVLKRLWDDRRGGQLLHAAYEAMGRLEGAIATKAEAVFGDLGPAEREAARRVFLQLVRPGQGAEDTRRRARLGDLGEGARAVVKRLADERLLVTAPAAPAGAAPVEPPRDPAAAPPPGPGEGNAAGETVEVSHEALIRHWDRLRTWVNADREFLLWRERFRGLLGEWQGRAKDAGALLSPALLLEAERWLAERRDQLTADEREYIDRGVEVRERDRRAEQERRERDIRKRSVRKTLAAVVGLVLVGVLGTLGASAARRESIRRSLASDLVWVRIPAPPGGEFLMGCVAGDTDCAEGERTPDAERNPRPPTQLSRAFELTAHEATVDRFRRFIDAQSTIIGRLLAPKGLVMEAQPDWSQGDHPVVLVSWDDARDFCAFVRGRLPTEAEWEYAARGGNAGRIYPWGNEYSPDQANGHGVGGKDRWNRSAPVESFPPNGYGLYDMGGNAWEWTSSVYADYPYRSDDGREDPAPRGARVVRGGSWNDDPLYLRASARGVNSPASRYVYLGFRCARNGSP
jgi:formylglycine-generating enzyme required for sulfatase activity